MPTRRYLACVFSLLMITVLSACVSNAPRGPAVNFSDAYDFSVVSRVAIAPYKAPAAGTEVLGEALSGRFRRGLEGALKDKGIKSPYLRPFVTARINPVRFKKEVTDSPEELIVKMKAAAEKFDVDKVRADQVTATGGYGGGDE